MNKTTIMFRAKANTMYFYAEIYLYWFCNFSFITYSLICNKFDKCFQRKISGNNSGGAFH